MLTASQAGKPSRLDVSTYIAKPGSSEGPAPGAESAVSVKEESLEDVQLTASIWEPDDVILGLYRVVGLVGEGGMGTVHRVHHLGWNMDLAIKSPRPEFFSNQRAQRLFEHEAEAWVDLGLHPNIASCFYVREVDSIPRIFIEYLDGGSLKDWLVAEKITSVGQSIDLGIQICDGMHHSHSKGLIHRDLKPGNCLLTENGNLKITDFGLAKWTSEGQESLVDAATEEELARGGHSISLEGGIAGTPEYMSPEQWAAFDSDDEKDESPEISPRTDIYSFGILLYEIVCGVRPFDDGNLPLVSLCYRHLREDPPPISTHLPDISDSLEAVVARALKKKPVDRYASFDEIRSDLEIVYKDVTGKPYPRKPPSAARHASDGLNNRAISLFDLGRSDDAHEELEGAIKADPSHLESNYNLSLLQWREGRITDEDVINRLEEIRNSRTNSSRACYLLGLVHMERRDARSAAKVLWDACRSEDVSPQTWIAYGEALSGDRKYAKAIRAFQNALKQKGNVDEIKRRAAVALYLSGQTTKAETLWGGPINSSINQYIFYGGGEVESYPAHTGPITAVDISQDGRLGASIGQDPDTSLKVWDLKKGECIFTENLDDAYFNCLSMSPSGAYLLVGDTNNYLYYWDVQAHELVHKFDAHRSGHVMAFLLNRQDTGVTVGHDSSISFWNLQKGKLHRTMRKGPKITAFAMPARGNTAISTNGTAIFAWDIEDGRFERFMVQPIPIACMDISQDFRYLVTGGSDQTVRLWDVKGKKPIGELTGHSGAILSVAFGPEAKTVVSIARDNTLRLWAMESGQCIFRMNVFAGHASPLAISQDGRFCIVGGWDKTLRHIDLGTSWPPAPLVPAEVVSSEDALKRQTLVEQMRGQAEIYLEKKQWSTAADFIQTARKVPGFERDPDLIEYWYRVSEGGKQKDLQNGWRLRTFQHPDSVTAVAFAHDSKFIMSGDNTGKLRMWHLQSGELLRLLEGHTSIINTLVIQPGDLTAWTGSSLGRGGDTTARLWDLLTGEARYTMQCIQGVADIAISPDNRYLLTATREVLRESPIQLWEIESQQSLREFEGHDEPATSIAFHPGGHLAISGSEDTTVMLWHVHSGKRLQVYDDHEELVSAVGFSPDGNIIYSTGLDGKVRLGDIRDPSSVRYLECGDGVTSAAFSPSGEILVLGILDSTIQLWNTSTGEKLRVFEGHTQEVNTVTFSNDGRFILSSSSDRTMILWELDWALEFPEPTNQVPELAPFLKNFLWLHTPAEPEQTQEPEWTEDEFQALLTRLRFAGLGWIRPDSIKKTLDQMASKWQAPAL